MKFYIQGWVILKMSRYVTFLKNKIEEQNKEESGSDDIKMDEDTVLADKSRTLFPSRF